MPKLRPYRCVNPKHSANPLEGHEFWSDSDNPTCSECGIARKAKHGDLIIPLVICHLDTPSEIPGRGTRIRPCDGKEIDKGGNQATGNPHVVNCPECRKTEVFVARMAEWEDIELEEARASIGQVLRSGQTRRG